ncbi:MAG: enoyl-CoA hydratase/isomerase family protein [Actinobacteria bacterium]|nr:enoyl-CoA hydratase/isomerase family protein [Actinomycetota bacterium]
MADLVRQDRDDRGVVTLTLDKPEVRNAFNPDFMQAIRAAFEGLREDDTLRAVVLTGEGQAFSAGADLNWMRSMKDYSYEDNVADSRELDALFRTIDGFPRPVVAKVNGAALGGAMGLIACADIAVASRAAVFGFSETKLGIAPAVISTYVQPKIGVSNARRYFLTGERFDADRAFSLGLVHEVCDPDDLDATTERVLVEVLTAGPAAQVAVKDLIPLVEGAASQAEAAEHTVAVISRLRVGDEGQEGMQAFFDKRPAAWVPQD